MAKFRCAVDATDYISIRKYDDEEMVINITDSGIEASVGIFIDSPEKLKKLIRKLKKVGRKTFQEGGSTGMGCTQH